ncbi:alpha/beta hydrolase [Mesorhizobium sp. M0092]|uniref:alpha/beta fold hydrolase n=1 Tax=unclassified Mesorhizobium TaxID=325217 RepID=UPI00333BDC67
MQRTTVENDSEAGFVHGYSEVGDVRLHHVSVGDGLPVLLIPGWPQTWYVWRHVMKGLAEAGFKTIAVDPRGIGQSSRPARGYDTATAAADLHGLMRLLGYARFQVVGHDIGKWIGYALAADFPDAVERVALMDASIPGIAPNAEIFGPVEKLKFRWHFMFNQLSDLPEMLIQGREAQYLTWMFEQWSVQREAVAVDTYIAAYSSPGALRAGFSYYRAIPETIAQNTERRKTRLKMPVLAMGGEFSAGDGSRAILVDVTEQLRGVVVKGSGHIGPEEAPEAVLRDLVPFLAGTD